MDRAIHSCAHTGRAAGGAGRGSILVPADANESLYLVSPFPERHAPRRGGVGKFFRNACPRPPPRVYTPAGSGERAPVFRVWSRLGYESPRNLRRRQRPAPWGGGSRRCARRVGARGRSPAPCGGSPSRSGDWRACARRGRRRANPSRRRGPGVNSRRIRCSRSSRQLETHVERWRTPGRGHGAADAGGMAGGTPRARTAAHADHDRPDRPLRADDADDAAAQAVRAVPGDGPAAHACRASRSAHVLAVDGRTTNATVGGPVLAPCEAALLDGRAAAPGAAGPGRRAGLREAERSLPAHESTP